MTIPNVKVNKARSQTGVVRPGDLGILAILAADDGSTTATHNTPATYTRPEDVVADRGYGRLAAFAAHTLDVTGNPILAIAPDASTAGAYGSITTTRVGSSTCVVTGDATTKPLDAWAPYVVIVAGGTIGVTGITYQTSLDGGATLGPVTALGTANTIAIPRSGVKFDLAAGTLDAGDKWTCACSPPLPTTADLVAALEALRVTSQPWDAALVDGVATGTVIAQLDTYLIALEQRGVFKSALCSVRMRNAGETEAQYATAMAAVVAAASNTDRVIVCADGGDMVDWKEGVKIARPAALYIAADGESLDPSTDPAYKALGPLSNCSIVDARGNPKYHDEDRYPGLDAMRLATLRSFPNEAAGNVYVTNANVFSASDSDYQWWQQLRVMNLACGIVWKVLTTQLSLGVTKSPKVGPNGARYISEQDAARIEALGNAALTKPLKNRVTGYKFSISRTDDLSSNGPGNVTSTMQIDGLSYIKKFTVNAGYVKFIA